MFWFSFLLLLAFLQLLSHCVSFFPQTLIHLAFFIGCGWILLVLKSNMIFTGRYEALSTPFLKEKEHEKCQNKQKEFLVERSWLFCKRFLEVSVHAIVCPIRPKWNKLHAVVSKKNSIQPINGVPLYYIYCHMIGPRRNKQKKFHEDVYTQFVVLPW